MAGVTDIVDVTGTDALLNVGQTGSGGMRGTHQIGNERMHACGCKENRRIVFRDDGGRLDAMVALAFHKGLEHFTQLGGCNLFHDT